MLFYEAYDLPIPNSIEEEVRLAEWINAGVENGCISKNIETLGSGRQIYHALTILS